VRQGWDDKTQKLMQKAVKELMKVHRLSERDAASLMITVTSVVGLADLIGDGEAAKEASK
jgi:hypothetical protein